MTEQLKPRITIEEDVKRFIYNWHEFPIDYWWRKRYNIPFGSQQHRSMNYIDMYIEYQEDLLLKERLQSIEDKQNEEINEQLGIKDDDGINLSQQEIDDDYENLDLSEFNK